MAHPPQVGEYAILGVLGSGSFAVVYRAKNVKTGLVVAIKSIRRDKLSKKLLENLESEISILKSLNHPNIVKLYSVEKTADHIHLILEHCGGGDLSSFIKKRKFLTESTARYLLRQLAHALSGSGLKYVHSFQIIHRDLKPSNLLLSHESEEPILKIADFGFARYMQPLAMAETTCGSPLYMAPEILRFEKYDAKADLWSVGAILFEMLTGKPPFTGENHLQLLRNIENQQLRLPKQVQVSAACLKLLQGLLRRNPIERISYEDFFTSPFVDLDNFQLLPDASPAFAQPEAPSSAAAAGAADASQALPQPVQHAPELTPPIDTVLSPATTTRLPDAQQPIIVRVAAPLLSAPLPVPSPSPVSSSPQTILRSSSQPQDLASRPQHALQPQSQATQSHRSPRTSLQDLVSQVHATLDMCTDLESRDQREDALALLVYLLRVLSSALPRLRTFIIQQAQQAGVPVQQLSGSGVSSGSRPRSRSSADAAPPVGMSRPRSVTSAGTPSPSTSPSPSPPSQIILGSPSPMPGMAAAAAAAAASQTSMVASQPKKPLPPGIDPVAFAAYRWLQSRFDDALVQASRLQQSLRPETRIGNPDEVLFRTTLDTVRAAATDELRGNYPGSVSKYRESLTMLVTLDRSADRMHAPAEDRDVLSSFIATVSRRLQDAQQRSSALAVPPSAAHGVLSEFE